MKKTVEHKIKKMCLNNIQGRLTPKEMEEIMAGSMSNGQCALLGFGFVMNAGLATLFFGSEIKQCWNS